jgi:hypothetical protein
VYSNITEVSTWKKRKMLADITKIFIIKGGYGDIKTALLDRGWVENTDKDSNIFDLKWTLKTKDIDHNSLKDH